MSKTFFETTEDLIKAQRYNRLHDAICEYIDEMEGEELVQVLASVLKKEIKYYTDKVEHLNTVLQKVTFNG